MKWADGPPEEKTSLGWNMIGYLDLVDNIKYVVYIQYFGFCGEEDLLLVEVVVTKRHGYYLFLRGVNLITYTIPGFKSHSSIPK